MERANDKNFFAACDALKKRVPLRVSNLFEDPHQLGKKFETSACYFLQTGASIFLITPSHEMLSNLHFLSSSPASLANDLGALVQEAGFPHKARSSVIGREEMCSSIVPILEERGFATRKKLLRMRLGEPDEKILDAMRTLAGDYVKLASFARVEDAEEILALIKDEFDVVGDNIPELDEIRENISKNNVTVLRMDGTIAAMHYFRVDKGISHGYFDITRKDFRGGNGLFFALNIFEREYFKKMGIKINRSLGWREATKTRLVKSSKKTSSFPDGIVIYNMLRQAGAAPQAAQVAAP